MSADDRKGDWLDLYVRQSSHLCQNRDPIANLGNLDSGPVRMDTDFNPHFDPLIFIVPVGLDGVDIDRELPRCGLYAYDLRSYGSRGYRPMKLQARKNWSHQESPCLGGTLVTRRPNTDVGCSSNGEESICSIGSSYNGFYNLFSNRVRCGHRVASL
jgi:hypothetical protein